MVLVRISIPFPATSILNTVICYWNKETIILNSHVNPLLLNGVFMHILMAYVSKLYFKSPCQILDSCTHGIPLEDVRVFFCSLQKPLPEVEWELEMLEQCQGLKPVVNLAQGKVMC